MTWLVTGGAGYIGAHVVRAFRAEGFAVRVLDDLSSGFEAFLPRDVAFVRGSLTDPAAVADALAPGPDGPVTGVVHLAGFKYAGVSVQRPVHTYEQNVVGTLRLVEAMLGHGVDQLVFSSSAAVYGTPDVDLVTETTATAPQSPYGESKLIGEWIIRDAATASSRLRHTSLRYFNVVGSGVDEVYDASPHNLFPAVLRMIDRGEAPQINGTDYDTPDGTCVRDYVHVSDVARAHVSAARRLADAAAIKSVYNLGSGSGLSVRRVVDVLLQASGSPLTATEAPRRPGDPARIVASGRLAARDLDWPTEHSVTRMAESAVRAWRASAVSRDTPAAASAVSRDTPAAT